MQKESIEIPTDQPTLKAKDFASDLDVKWCPGCGDYAILKQVQTVLADEHIAKENTVFISGIGCSSRFPYYMNTYGMHSIHGRAPAIATGVKALNPQLDVWVITGDGDALAIGGNHFIHALRRNIDLNILLFNNQIYGLTKGQYSPTSEIEKKTVSSPHGSIDYPFNPVALALSAGGTFVARAFDNQVKHMRTILSLAHAHQGTSFVEIYQNCPIFNDKIFAEITDKSVREERTLLMEQGQPLVFGANEDKGIKLDGLQPRVVTLDDNTRREDLWIHDTGDRRKAQILADFFYMPDDEGFLPRPFGVFYEEQKNTYDALMSQQIDTAVEKMGTGDLDAILAGKSTWTID